MSQKDTFDLQDFLPYLLNQAAEESSLSFQRFYKERYGMLRTEWRVLFHLGIYGQMTAKEIGLKARIHKTKISRAVARLQERRFLSRRTDEQDRRSEKLSLTPQGQAVYEDLQNYSRDYDARLVAPFSAEETRLLRKMLKHLSGMR